VCRGCVSSVRSVCVECAEGVCVVCGGCVWSVAVTVWQLEDVQRVVGCVCSHWCGECTVCGAVCALSTMNETVLQKRPIILRSLLIL